MKVDPIVEEIDRLRAEEMERIDFDFAAFYRDLKEQQRLLSQRVQPPPDSPPNPRFNRAAGRAGRR